MQFLFTFFAILFSFNGMTAENIDGAWMNAEGDTHTVLLFSDGYFTMTKYTSAKFLESSGGMFSLDGNEIEVHEEFNTAVKELSTVSYPVSIGKDELTFGRSDQKFVRIDDGNNPLSGVWIISGRMRDGKVVPVQHTGARKTLKMLTGKRFQWFAIDPSTNSFSGTGGGTFTFKDGKYTENIEFFSRDSTRVGSSLLFEDHLEDGKWHHTGLSSKGATIYEIWEKAR